jgi:hypothetical protein
LLCNGKEILLLNIRETVFCVDNDEELQKGQRKSFKSVEFRDTSLPGYELGSRVIVKGTERLSGDVSRMIKKK